jgi:hypothetical protein
MNHRIALAIKDGIGNYPEGIFTVSVKIRVQDTWFNSGNIQSLDYEFLGVSTRSQS